MRVYLFEEFNEDLKELSSKIKARFIPEAILAVARGGLTLGHFLAMSFNNRNLFTLNCIHYEGNKKLDELKIFNVPNLEGFKRVLIVDDMVDSGESMKEIKSLVEAKFKSCEFRVATIFYKKDSIFMPDFTLKEATEWIEFFWERV
ncbi:phosphoribosyltransferase [Campylobacter troglodytis]|uniref:phosphoribosyltransferase n=1 Tax=Campylobacter troglodytis TaxID=654363 RepID=UPI001157A468|nr:phosphoribosyltransferase family protein [Campylobacter troglodytis]TQR59069.1 nicotinate phosphoribosyltransferase [Campylobacter troglodytis]